MSDGLQIALTALLAVVVFVVGELLQKVFIEPIQDVRRTVGRIAHALTFYRNAMGQKKLSIGDAVVGMPPEELREVQKTIRGLASDLRAGPAVIPLYRLFAVIRLVPSREAIKSASTHLIGWSNSLGGDSG